LRRRLRRINDTFGHAVGDELLRRVASVLAANVRPTDVVARLG
jgi:diguanylate cyclase